MAKEVRKPKKNKKPAKCISVEEARELHDNWDKQRGHHLKKCLGHEDTREFWWSVEELQEYLKYVKKESKKQGIENPGIRMYLGAYSKSKCKMGKGYTTLFLAPTGSRPGTLGKDGRDGNDGGDGRDGDDNNTDIDAYNGAGSGHPPRRY